MFESRIAYYYSRAVTHAMTVRPHRSVSAVPQLPMNAPEDRGGYIRLATDSLQFFFVALGNDDEPFLY
ncbi:hypothetical protein Caka_2965 [Coraliomargarita akajimensis DSM 45221]|uniref:Uncharacterized protein n=1 Tax=Coraliomargarita akajimensis (strain DSM 45221 / IAM 15411 / JCM 23193 / KCTC 12865 / 04OKA010-24) TaxID=583355 RepID=D5ERD4_CORAD|nr:hypothetical protein Caka_2965 [Coraliomargarita akajimensis DSM 45221]